MADHIQIGDIAPRIQYVANGTQTQFTYPFPIFVTADLEVYLGTVKQTSGYTVAGAGASAGGSVTFTAAPANGTVVTLRRRIAIQRTSDFQESGEFRAKVINDELDYQTAALQQVADDAGRTIRLSATDAAADLTLPVKATRASKVLGFDANGDPVEYAAVGIWRGAWSGATAYAVNDLVSSGGASYICVLAHTNQQPPNATYWNTVAAKGDTGATGATGPVAVAFKTIAVSGQSDVVADAAEDTLTLVAGTNVTITTNAAGDTITFTAATPTQSFVVACSDETTAITSGTAKVTFRMPYAFTVSAVRASLSTASTSGAPQIDINESGTTILSTPITIDANEKTSTTAATPPVISDSALADDAEITIDIDSAGTGAKGLKVEIIGTKA